jgi:hypothetical protein
VTVTRLTKFYATVEWCGINGHRSTRFRRETGREVAMDKWDAVTYYTSCHRESDHLRTLDVSRLGQ